MSSRVFSFEKPRESEREKLHDIVGHAFGFPPVDAGRWLHQAGEEHVRAYVGDGEVIGGLLEIPMGQFFGGRSVSTLGVAGVAIAPTLRGQGHAAGMMVAMLREAKARGFALSSLYPASVTLYRRAGYERAGARFGFRLDPRHIEMPRQKEMTVGEVTTYEPTAAGVQLPAELRALYTRFAQKTPGFLDRGPYVWNRVIHPRGLATKTFTIHHGSELEGYLSLAHVNPPSGFPTFVHLTDFAATTPRAVRAILRFLVEYRSLADLVRWEGSPTELLATMLPERHLDIKLSDYFMIRVVDPARALAERGYPSGERRGVTFELQDTSLPESSGRYDLGGGGALVRINENGLAALFSGASQAHVLADSGWLEADEDTQTLLDAWFSGPMPTMRDHF